MDYLAAVAAAIAGIVGSVGDTWNERRKGMRRLTATGWAVLMCALVALAVSIWQTRSTNAKLAATERTRERYREQAYSDICAALGSIDDAFIVPYFQSLGVDSLHKTPRGRARSKSNKWWLLLTPDSHSHFFGFLATMKMTKSPTFSLTLNRETYAHFMARKFRRAHRDLEILLTVYGPY